MNTLQKYVGRIVQLNEKTFRPIARQARPDATPPENRFLVAAVSREMNKLICYGAGTRIAVCSSDIVLV